MCIGRAFSFDKIKMAFTMDMRLMAAIKKGNFIQVDYNYLLPNAGTYRSDLLLRNVFKQKVFNNPNGAFGLLQDG